MSQPRTLVSVIMPHYGCEAYLAQAIHSILSQSLAELEVLVIDDASASPEWLARIQSFRHDARLRVYRASKHVGPYRIRNMALALCRGSLLAFQDADDVSAPERLAVQIDDLSRNHADVMGCGFRYISEDGLVIQTRKMVRSVNFWLRLGKSFSILPISMVIPRRAFEALGGFDGTTQIAADTDFILRAAHSFRLRNVKRSLYDYRIRTGSLTHHPSTGFASIARQSYVQEMWRREKQRVNATNPQKLRELLVAPSNDVSFDLLPC